MSVVTRTIDRYYAMKVMGALVKDFTEWDAFKTGVIDAMGNVVSKPKTSEQKDSYTRFDAILRSIKRVLNRFPGGAKTLAQAYLTKGYLYESAAPGEPWRERAMFQLGFCENEEDFHKLSDLMEALCGYNKDDPFFVEIFEEMVAGDAGGDPQKIAAGTNSGAITRGAPEVLKRKKRAKQNPEEKA